MPPRYQPNPLPALLPWVIGLFGIAAVGAVSRRRARTAPAVPGRAAPTGPARSPAAPLPSPPAGPGAPPYVGKAYQRSPYAKIPGKSSDPYAAAREAVRARINQLRATAGLPALARWQAGEACADEQCRKDSLAGASHSSFGQCGEWAQNECPAWPNDTNAIAQQCMQMMWDEGPGQGPAHGHYVNMTNPSYTKVAVGFYRTPGGQLWSIQNFQ